MTYIEFFDKSSTENIAACLTHTPDTVILIGASSSLMEKYINSYNKVFEGIKFLYKTVSKCNLSQAVNLLQDIVDTYDDCVFDVTGGEEILNLALGVVYERNPDKNIQINKFSLDYNRVYDCDKDGNTIYKDVPVLSVEENVKIYCGDIVYGDVYGEDTYKWDMNTEFKKDIELIWNVYKGNVRLWNTQIGVFEAAEKVGTVDIAKLSTTADIQSMERYLERDRADYKISKGIIKYLLTNGLIKEFSDDEGTFRITYKNPQVKRCLIKAGQALEMKIFSIASSIKDKGENVYNDVMNGVVIDWDGELHQEDDQVIETENEIDVFLMHNMIPVFVSCKSGRVTADELYKLETVARRFGSKYARRVLIATSVSRLGLQGKYLIERAKDMNIELIDEVHKMSEAELHRKIGNLWINKNTDNQKK